MQKSRKNSKNKSQKKLRSRNFSSAGQQVAKIERMEHPPQINGYEITHKKRLRFTCPAALTGVTITYQNILDTMLVAVTTTSGYDVFDIVKVKKVEVWSQAALGTPSTITVIYTTPNFGDRSVHTDTSLGVKPAFVRAIPSQSSLASFWQVSGAGNCFTITCPAGSIIDCSFVFRTTNAAAVATQNNLTAATVGEFYFRGLDGVGLAGSAIPPIVGVAAI